MWTRVFEKRLLTGPPLRHWCHEHASGDGVVDWSMGGVYELKWNEEGRATSAIYVSGAVEAPINLVVTRDMVLKDPWDIREAGLVKKPANYKLIDFFEVETGP